MEQYTNMSNIYDKMIDMDYDAWIEFLNKFFISQKDSLRSKKCLELGCGTGNMTLRLKKSGVDITGFDISPYMLSVAEEKLRANKYIVRFINGDMSDINIGKKFDIICSFCDGYNYIIEEDDLENSFNKVFNHLENKGYFIFDISTEHKLKNIIGNNTFTLNEDELCYIWDNYIEDDILEMYITFFEKHGEMYKRFEENHVQRAWGTNFILDKLKKCGFSNIHVFDNYSFNNINDKSVRATIVAKKEE